MRLHLYLFFLFSPGRKIPDLSETAKRTEGKYVEELTKNSSRSKERLLNFTALFLCYHLNQEPLSRSKFLGNGFVPWTEIKQLKSLYLLLLAVKKSNYFQRYATAKSTRRANE